MVKCNNDWDDILQFESKLPYYKDLYKFLVEEYNTQTIYPKSCDIFNAFKITPLEEIKVIIIGQDPYHEKNQAMGLSFSVPNGVKVPPSLQNIYKEIKNEYMDWEIPKNGDLTKWAEQGVFLLNTTMTVREGQPLSHYGHGWEHFTDKIIEYINNTNQPKVWILWGSNARKKKDLISKNPKTLILESAHPSPLSAYRGFFGSNHFKKCNEFLKNNGEKEIEW